MISIFTKKNLRSIKLSALLIFLVSNPIFSQIAVFDSLVNTGISQIYNIKFNEAESTFAKLGKKYPKHPASLFFDAMIVWWKIMLDQDNEQYDEIFEDKLEKVIDFCDDLLDENENNVDAIFFKGGSLGFRGRLYSIRQEWFKAALDGKDALPLVYEAFKIDSTNEDVKLGFGIYNYYAEAIPEKYPFIKPAMVFFPSGDKKKGIKQLESAAKKAKYAAIESQFFLMNLYYQFEENFDEALVYAKVLNTNFPDNPIFQKYVGRIFVKKGDYGKASVIFGDIEKKCNRKMPGYNQTLLREATYYLGVNYMRINEIDSAKNSFLISTELSKIIEKEKDEESGFLVNGMMYLGKISSQKGQIELAKKYYHEILDMRDYAGSHKKVEGYLSKLEKK